MKHLKKFERKTIMNLFICFYESPYWEKSIEILRSLQLPTSIEVSKGHHRGLAVQVLLDTNLEDSKRIAEDVFKKFPEEPIIVLSEINVIMKKIPIGHYYDDDLVEPGRYFDQLVSQRKSGIFIYDDTTTKVIK
jgi:hypothetical protein